MSVKKENPETPWRTPKAPHPYAAGPRAKAANTLPVTFEDRLKRILSETTGLDEGLITHASLLRADLGLDSLDLTEVFMRLAESTGIEPSEEYDFDRLQTFGDLLLLAVNLDTEEPPGEGPQEAPPA